MSQDEVYGDQTRRIFSILELDLRMKGDNAAPYWQIRSKTVSDSQL